MTFEQLVLLPKGTRIKFSLAPDLGFDYGTIRGRFVDGGIIVDWDPDERVLSHTTIMYNSPPWSEFVQDVEVV